MLIQFRQIQPSKFKVYIFQCLSNHRRFHKRFCSSQKSNKSSIRNLRVLRFGWKIPKKKSFSHHLFGPSPRFTVDGWQCTYQEQRTWKYLGIPITKCTPTSPPTPPKKRRFGNPLRFDLRFLEGFFKGGFPMWSGKNGGFLKDLA